MSAQPVAMVTHQILLLDRLPHTHTHTHQLRRVQTVYLTWWATAWHCKYDKCASATCLFWAWRWKWKLRRGDYRKSEKESEKQTDLVGEQSIPVFGAPGVTVRGQSGAAATSRLKAPDFTTQYFNWGKNIVCFFLIILLFCPTPLDIINIRPLPQRLLQKLHLQRNINDGWRE